jgi:hypothetical protein
MARASALQTFPLDRKGWGNYNTSEIMSMKTHGTKLAVGVALACLAACAAPGVAQRDPLIWQGASAEDLAKGLGQPQARESLATGETVLQYNWTNTYVAGGYTTTPGGGLYTGSNWDLPRTYEPTRTVALTCVARFTIGTDDRVNHVDTQGDGC